MANLLTSRRQKSKERARLAARALGTGQTAHRTAQKQEAFFIKRLSQELGVDIAKIISETEDKFDPDRARMQARVEKQRQAVRKFALGNRRRIEQAIKTYDKQGLLEATRRLHPNQPHLRMKFAGDWSGSFEPPGVPGIGAEYAVADAQFDPVRDAAGELLPNPGHAGLCNQLRARAHACAGDHRFGHKTATTEQELVFYHDAPPSVGGMQNCAVNEVWVPMTLTGLSYAAPSDAIFLTQSLALSGGGVAEVRLSIDVEQDTDTRPLVFPVVEDHVLHSNYARGGQWLFGALGPNTGTLHDGPTPIDVEINAPWRLPIMLQTADHGGGEVRVTVRFNCYTDAKHRRAEAEIDLQSEGAGVTIHEVFLHVSAYIGY